MDKFMALLFHLWVLQKIIITCYFIINFMII